MRISQITERISPAKIYRNIIEHHRARVANRILKNEEKADKVFLKNHPDVAEKREELNKFISKPPHPYQPDGTEYIPTCSQLPNVSSDKVIALCADNLPKIKYVLGEYGLAHWASQRASKVVKNVKSEIKETGITDGKKSIGQAIDEYINANPTGKTDDIYERFGQCGRNMYRGYQKAGFVSGTISYRLTNYGKQQMRTAATANNIIKI